MRITNYNAIKAALLPYYGEVYLDDNAVVAMEGDSSTLAYIFPSRRGFMYVAPANGSPTFEVACDGIESEQHEIPQGGAQ